MSLGPASHAQEKCDGPPHFAPSGLGIWVLRDDLQDDGFLAVLLSAGAW